MKAYDVITYTMCVNIIFILVVSLGVWSTGINEGMDFTRMLFDVTLDSMFSMAISFILGYSVIRLAGIDSTRVAAAVIFFNVFRTVWDINIRIVDELHIVISNVSLSSLLFWLGVSLLSIGIIQILSGGFKSYD